MAVTTAAGFRFQRLTLAAATLTEILPLIDAREVSIANGTGALLEIHTNADGLEFRTLAAGAERTFRVTSTPLLLFRRGQPAFWLKSTPGGLVILTWAP